MKAPRSTAGFIPYDLRPAKQAERRILLDILKISADTGLPISQYRYVGMGGNRFYDFLLMHKYIGIGSMISLEHDPNMYKRAVYSCPYNFIDVAQTSVSSFIESDGFEKPTVCWFDYDGGIGKAIVSDIAALAPKINPGDMIYATVSGHPPGLIQKTNAQERLAWFQDEIGEVSGEVKIEDVENRQFTVAVHKVLVAALTNAFAARKDAQFLIMLQVEYSDTMPMVTVGGALLLEEQALKVRKGISQGIPFLKTDKPDLYRIKSPNLTERERSLFDRASTYKNRRSQDRNQLIKLGFTDEDIDTYRELLRYIPRYVETMV